MQEGKVAVIAGMGGVRDAVFAKTLAADGISVELLTHGEGDSFPDAATNISVSRLDITREEEIQRSVGAVAERHGTIDFLITCPEFRIDSALVDLPEEEWERSVALNLTSVFMICKHVVPVMIRSRAGSIIHLSSDGGRMGIMRGAAYAAAKAGVGTFSKALAREVAGYGIRVNVLSTGLIGEDALPLGADGGTGDILLKRKGTWEEVAHMALCLLHERSSYVTGQTVHVNGGLYMP